MALLCYFFLAFLALGAAFFFTTLGATFFFATFFAMFFSPLLSSFPHLDWIFLIFLLMVLYNHCAITIDIFFKIFFAASINC